jgi:hypothetical protein
VSCDLVRRALLAGALPLFVLATPALAADDAAFVSQQVPTRAVVGETLQVSITLKNTGTRSWTRGRGVALGTVAPRNDGTWGARRIRLRPKARVRPGETHTFTREVRAPTLPGVYSMKWRLVREEAPAQAGDAIDLSQVTFLHANVSGWPATSRVERVEVGPGRICVDHSKLGTWPSLVLQGEAIEGNPWVVAQVGGRWYAGTYEWLRPGQHCKTLGATPPTSTVADQLGPHIKQAPLDGWRPRPGERVGVFVSTHARGSERTLNERTNVVAFEWPAAGATRVLDVSGGTPAAPRWFGAASRAVQVTVTPRSPGGPWPAYPSNPYTIRLNQPVLADDPRGSLFAHELDGDGLMDFVVTGPNVVGAYDHWGNLLWKVADPIHLPGAANGGRNYPGSNAPGAIAGDLDRDGAAEVAYLTDAGDLVIRDGASGARERTWSFPGAQALSVANLRGQGETDAVLQYGQSEVRGVNLRNGNQLWRSTEWRGIEHSQVRTTDVDGDGRDEVLGAVFLDDDGSRLSGWDLQAQGHAISGLDSLAIGAVIPGGPVEVAFAEQGGKNQTVLVNHRRYLWGRGGGPIPALGDCAREIDPDKVAVGDFDPALPGLEVFARSACGRFPWVHGADGAVIARWSVEDRAPPGWYLGGPPLARSEGGIDVVRAIDWRGRTKRYLLLKERHLDRRAAIVEPLSGRFLRVFDVRASRLYAADVSDDHREEVIVLEAGARGTIRIFANEAAAPPPRPRPWTDPVYRRVRQNWNYYSP